MLFGRDLSGEIRDKSTHEHTFVGNEGTFRVGVGGCEVDEKNLGRERKI